MTHPVAEAYATTTDSGRSGTTLSLNIPIGVNAGEVLYAVITDYTASVPTFPAGWTTAWSATDTFSSFNCTGIGAWKLADGTETGTISVTVSTGGCCGVMYRISGAANPNDQPPVSVTHSKIDDYIAAGVRATGSVVLPEVDSETNDYLSFAALCWEVGTDTIADNPQDYSSVLTINSGTSVGMWIGHRDVTGPMEVTTDWDPNVERQGVIAVTLFYPKIKHVYSTTHPYVRSIATTGEEGRVTSSTFKATMPRVVRPGDVVFLFISQYNVIPPQISMPNGWTELYETYAASAGPSSPYVLHACYYKRVTGEEGATLTIPTIAEATTCSMAFSIGNVEDLVNYPPVYVEDSGNQGDVDNFTPSYGSANYLFMAVSAFNSNYAPATTNAFATSLTGFPTGTSDFPSRAYVHADDTTTPGANCGIVACWDQQTASSVTATGFSFIPVADYTPANTVTIAIYGGVPDETSDNFWYLNWRGRGRNGFM